jgi:hypothetical protein
MQDQQVARRHENGRLPNQEYFTHVKTTEIWLSSEGLQVNVRSICRTDRSFH